MKIAHYATLSSLVLLLVAGVQAAALFHGWQRLQQTEQAQRQHERLQQDQRQKASQLSSVSLSLQEMVDQVQEIHHLSLIHI